MYKIPNSTDMICQWFWKGQSFVWKGASAKCAEGIRSQDWCVFKWTICINLFWNWLRNVDIKLKLFDFVKIIQQFTTPAGRQRWECSIEKRRRIWQGAWFCGSSNIFFDSRTTIWYVSLKFGHRCFVNSIFKVMESRIRNLQATIDQLASGMPKYATNLKIFYFRSAPT